MKLCSAVVTKVKLVRYLGKANTVTQSRRPLRVHSWMGGAAFRSALLLLNFLVSVTGALAQGILAPSSADFERSTYAPSLPAYQTGGVPAFLPQTLGLVQSGVSVFHPSLTYQFIYGDGVPATPTNHVTTAIQEISPGLLLNLGKHWILNYGATLYFYSNPQFSDSTSQNVILTGNTQYEDWAFHLSQAYSYADVSLIETEAQTAQTSYITALTASRQMGSHLSAQWSLNQNISSTSISGSTNSQNVDSWVFSSGLNYQTAYKFGFGINASAGYNLITPGENMKFEQVQGTVNWQPTDKFNATASVGVEDTQLQGTQLIDPTFSAAINYHPFEQTSASLTASRTVNPSYFSGDVLVSTTISATFRQRFLQHFTFELSGGYSTTPYVGFATMEEFIPNDHQIGAPVFTANVQQNRTDDTEFARVSVGSTFRQRGTVSIFYTYTGTTSSLAAYTLSSTQVGLEIGWHY